MRIGWCTDIHLDHLDTAAIDAFAAQIAAAADVLLIGGDISTATRLELDLGRLVAPLAIPVFFVLGNHDFYRGSLDGTRDAAGRVTAAHGQARYLPALEPVALAPGVGLVGVDGWGDARLGTPATSRVLLNDFFLIEDLAGRLGAPLHEALRALGDREAASLAPRLEHALRSFPRVIVLTHVPPFREASWHEGRLSDDEWLPYFTCRAVGDVLLEAAARHPLRQILVLCGHTHGAGEAQLAPNLRARTGGAVYGAPRLERVDPAWG